MRDKFKEITEHMRIFGCALIGKATYEAIYLETYDFAHASSIVTAAHGAEIILKSCISAEHPLLIFEKIPKINFNDNFVEQIFENGKTVRYADLPDLFYLTTGCQIEKRREFDNFGKLRNKIIHCGVKSELNYSLETIKFVIEIIEPIINKFWKATIFREVTGVDSDAKYYLLEQCVIAHKDGKLNFKLSEIALQQLDKDDNEYLMRTFQINLDDYV